MKAKGLEAARHPQAHFAANQPKTWPSKMVEIGNYDLVRGRRMGILPNSKGAKDI